MSSMQELERGPSRASWCVCAAGTVERITLVSPSGLSCVLSNWGASLLRLDVPRSGGQGSTNVVLGYATFEEYERDPFYLGLTVGRVANRIARGAFSLGGRDFQLETNDGIDHLHGGPRGWGARLWETENVTRTSVTFRLVSADGDSGYPGSVEARVTYRVEESRLLIDMSASADTPTLINMAHHSYFNLDGEGSTLDHELQLFSDEYTPGAPQIPDGRVHPVAETPLDFRTMRRIGESLPEVPGAPRGFDHNLLVRGAREYTVARSAEEPLRPVAWVRGPKSGREMRLSSNQPGVQLYSGNYLDGREGDGGKMEQHSGFCLETQACPGAIHLPAFVDQVTLAPGTPYLHTMAFEFSGPV